MRKINYIEDLKGWQSDFQYSVPIKVRFSETDLYGHVNNTAAFIYFEEARIEYLQSINFFNEIDIKKNGVVVADLQCNFLKQMYFNEVIDFYVKVNEVGNSSFDLHYMAMNQKKEMTLTGRGRLVYMDFVKGNSEPIPEQIIDVLRNEAKYVKVNA